MKKELTLFPIELFPELFNREKSVIKTKKNQKTQKKFRRKKGQPFSELDKQFWQAQDDWESSNFDLKSKAWKVMWERVQHAVYNVLFKRLSFYKDFDDIESLSFEISSNIMSGFIKKVKNGKTWKVKAPIAGYCTPFCMVIYSDKQKHIDKEASYEEMAENEYDNGNEYLNFKYENGIYKEVRYGYESDCD